MAKEFDIYLNKRLHQCDIIVYSIPYRDGLTVTERMILETCLESYLLQKFIAVQSGSTLVSHIDKMIKRCLERLDHGIDIGTNAEFQVHYSTYPDTTALEVNAEKLSLLAYSYMSTDNILQISTPRIKACIKKSLGQGQSGIDVASNVKATLKRDLEKASDRLVIKAEDLKTKKKFYEKVTAPILINTELTNFLYRRYFDVSPSEIQIASGSVEAEIRFSLGRCTFPIIPDSQMLGEQMIKYLTPENAIEIQSSATGTLRQFIYPEENTIEVYPLDVEVIVKRHRLLYEMDSDTLDTYDDMSLNDVDYVIL